MFKVTKVLRQLREDKKRTQEYMGMKLGISQSQYNKLENQDRSLDLNMIVAIADIFDLPPIDLLKLMFEEEHKVKSFVIDDLKKDTSEPEGYYKELANCFEKRFLSIYRLYIELCNKHNYLIDETLFLENLERA